MNGGPYNYGNQPDDCIAHPWRYHPDYCKCIRAGGSHANCNAQTPANKDTVCFSIGDVVRAGRKVVGFGDTEDIMAPVATAAGASSIFLALAGGAAAAATGFVLEEVWEAIRGRRRDR